MAIYQKRKAGYGRIVGAIALMGGYVIVNFPNRSLAQSNIVPDNTLGAESSFVVPNFNGLPVEAIGGGAVRGQNLFHSFQEFNVSDGRGAYFFSPNAAIENILARVTGTNRSEILGVLGTFRFVNGTPAPSNANLFLINPNGIIFGQNASLNVGGSFFASTANSVVFGNGYQFSSTNPQAPPLLTINVPLGLQFGANPGRIVNQSVDSLQLNPGRTLGLVGGEVALEGGSLFAPDGRIELGGVAGDNRVSLRPISTGYAIGYEGVRDFQDIRLSQFAIVSSSGDGGGSVQVQGRNVSLANGSQISANVLGSGMGGGLTINASESVQVIGRSTDGQVPSGLFARARERATGQAGDLTITTPQLLVRDGAAINASTVGAGKGGDLIINASNSVQLIGTSLNGRIGSGLFVQTSGTGNAGELNIITSQLLIQDGAGISASTFSSGKGGNVTVNASEKVQLIGTSTDGQNPSRLFAQAEGIGNAGNLTIITRDLLILSGAQISATTLNVGRGGNLTIRASDSVQVIGESADGQFSSRLVAQAVPNSKGDAGNLNITTSRLLIRDGAEINSSTFGAGKGGNLIVDALEFVQVIGTSADGQFGSNLAAQANRNSTGDAGDLTITTGQLLIQDGAFVSARTFGSGKGGILMVDASDSVQVIGTSPNSKFGSTLAVDSRGRGDAGEMRINTSRLLIQEGAFVSASTYAAGKGGSLTVNASDSVQVMGTSSDGKLVSNLSAPANPGSTGDAGDLTITTSQLLIQDGAFVSASTFGAGKGGSLTVNASESVRVIGTSLDGRYGSYLIAQANPNSTGDAGDLTITTSELLIRDGGQVGASTFGSGKGGNLIVNASDSIQVIGTSADGRLPSNLAAQTNEGTGNAGNLTITTSELIIRDGAFVSTGSLGSGKGGNLILNASDSVQVIGTFAQGELPSILGALATAGGTAGNLTVETGQMSVQDGAQVTVSSPSGQASNMTITADSLTLNRGTISAVTGKSGLEGGANITLQGLDLLRMDNESLISASALEDANGGNVTIDSSFIVATPPTGSKGSDITANAVRGNGGNVNVTTQGLFGIEFRPKLTPDNDITASSDFGIAGLVDINTPGVDPSRGLSELPSDVVDATQQIDRRCTPAAAAQKSSFVITGRGGLPPSPNEVLQGESVITNWVALDSQEENTNGTAPQHHPTKTAPKPLVEAQSWVYGPNGEVILTAQSPTATPVSPWQTPPSCDAVGRGGEGVFNAEERGGGRRGTLREDVEDDGK